MTQLVVFAILGICAAGPALGADYSVSAELKVSARIVNLSLMPVEDALMFCEVHGMACTAIREKAAAEDLTPEDIPVYEAEDWVYVDETGYGENYQWVGE